jgi:hypothetical protein
MPDMIFEPRASIIPPEREVLETGADVKSSVALEKRREAWQKLIDDKLIEWGSNPGQLDEERTTTPSRSTIRLATQWASKLSRQGFPAPLRVVPDAHGGIVFERREHDVFETLRFGADQSIEHCVFRNWKLVVRESW